jgi:hypothetical protein
MMWGVEPESGIGGEGGLFGRVEIRWVERAGKTQEQGFLTPDSRPEDQSTDLNRQVNERPPCNRLFSTVLTGREE